jgi:hypothetical protein
LGAGGSELIFDFLAPLSQNWERGWGCSLRPEGRASECLTNSLSSYITRRLDLLMFPLLNKERARVRFRIGLSPVTSFAGISLSLFNPNQLRQDAIQAAVDIDMLNFFGNSF